MWSMRLLLNKFNPICNNYGIFLCWWSQMRILFAQFCIFCLLQNPFKPLLRKVSSYLWWMARTKTGQTFQFLQEMLQLPLLQTLQYPNFNKTVVTLSYVRANISIVSMRCLFKVILLSKTLKNVHWKNLHIFVEYRKKNQVNMFSIYRELHPPTVVDHAVKCHFFDDQEINLVTAGSSRIHVYRLYEADEVCRDLMFLVFIKLPNTSFHGLMLKNIS